MRGKKVIELPAQDDNIPAGLFSIEVGNSRLVLDAEGNQKPPAEIRMLNRRSRKQVRRTKQHSNHALTMPTDVCASAERSSSSTARVAAASALGSTSSAGSSKAKVRAEQQLANPA